MWIYVIIIIFILFIIYKERQALGCPTIPTGKDCDNENGKAVKGTKPKPTDSDETLFHKIKRAAYFKERWVIWRLSVIIAALSSVLIHFFLQQQFPSEKELIVELFVITTIVYFTINFYNFHLISYIEKNINDSVNILTKNL